MKVSSDELKRRQSWSLERKILESIERITQWYEYWDGQVYIAFSGGKDSTVLLNLVRSIYPDVKAVFINTGLEYPEILKFVKTIKNVDWIRSGKKFPDIIKKYGYPVISKTISMGLDRYHNGNDYQKNLRLHGGYAIKSGKKQAPTISKKWHFLKDAPFKCSDRCCYHLKKSAFASYETKHKLKPFDGSMATESKIRKDNYMKTGCNSFSSKKPISRAISFWKESDIWSYIKIYNLLYSKIYDMNYDRTGCMFCMFGINFEKGENRFQKMKKTHPKHYKYCIEKLGIGDVLDYIGIEY